MVADQRNRPARGRSIGDVDVIFFKILANVGWLDRPNGFPNGENVRPPQFAVLNTMTQFEGIVEY